MSIKKVIGARLHIRIWHVRAMSGGFPRLPSLAKNRLAIFCLLLLATAPWSNTAAYGQSFVNGSITVIVSDPTGAVLPETTLTLTNLGTKASTAEISDSVGAAQFSNLRPATYSLRASHAGFATTIQTPIVLAVNGTLRINITMAPGSISQSVEVKAQALTLHPETSSLGQVVQQKMTTHLPLNGGNPVALVELAPGVVPQGGSGLNPVLGNSFEAGDFQVSGAPANMSQEYWEGSQ